MDPGLAERLRARALKLDAQRQPAKNILEPMRDFRFSVSPAGRNGQRLDVMAHFGVRRIDHYGQRVSTLFNQRDQLLEHSRKESRLQVTRIESNTAHYNPVVRKLRKDEVGNRRVSVAISPFYHVRVDIDGPGL